MSLIRLLIELFFANRNTPKKKVFYLKAKVFCGENKNHCRLEKHFCQIFWWLSEITIYNFRENLMFFVFLFFNTKKKQFQIFCLVSEIIFGVSVLNVFKERIDFERVKKPQCFVFWLNVSSNCKLPGTSEISILNRPC